MFGQTPYAFLLCTFCRDFLFGKILPLVPAENELGGNMKTVKKEQNELRMFLTFIAAAVVLIGIGIIIWLVSQSGSIGGFFEKLGETNIWLLIISSVAIVGGIAWSIWLRSKSDVTKSQWTTNELVTAALCIGLSFVLSYVKVFSFPTGGSITPASMLPVMLFAHIYGFKKGLVAAIVFGIMELIQEPIIIHWMQPILDYALGFGALSLTGLFKKNIFVGISVASFARYIFSTLSGAIFFGEYAPAGVHPILYSLGYNATYMLPECIICCAVALIPGMRASINTLKSRTLAKQAVKS